MPTYVGVFCRSTAINKYMEITMDIRTHIRLHMDTHTYLNVSRSFSFLTECHNMVLWLLFWTDCIHTVVQLDDATLNKKNIVSIITS